MTDLCEQIIELEERALSESIWSILAPQLSEKDVGVVSKSLEANFGHSLGQPVSIYGQQLPLHAAAEKLGLPLDARSEMAVCKIVEVMTAHSTVAVCGRAGMAFFLLLICLLISMHRQRKIVFHCIACRSHVSEGHTTVH